ncbi:ROK family protein [Chitinophaga pinensis]|uniref:ROK family protein n=1 Tax=Chitinophaga pinensis (strain ATCC 43595 / DSM 2588 / LMG 13176 / NBRC 15968 / NCIMB 11800 / UQM 2034) TaxID=485918 RepID=A0A979GZI4_CHIPD|nr:ROK family protein [Chitinophaga pinensis]ACU63966.1 ROK family protein [Chitinophaga pinensis DSM 2588]
MSQQLAVGIDIGGTNTKFGIVDRRGNILCDGRMLTNQHEDVHGFLDELHEHLSVLIAQVGGIENIRGIGVGAPNGNFYTGNIEYAPNLRWKGIIPLAKLLGEKFGVPAILTNDANAAALGEFQYGAARSMRDFIVITLGTGVGSGIVANGQLIYGHDGFAGELGHCIVIPGGRYHPGTGAHGSLEAYASATGVTNTALEFLANRPDTQSILRDHSKEEINSKVIYEAAMKGDPLAVEVYEFTGKILGEALANFVMFSSPEAIILFGGLTKAGDMIMKPVREHMEKNLLPIFQNKVKLVFSELKESDAAILGASALAWEMKD